MLRMSLVLFYVQLMIGNRPIMMVHLTHIDDKLTYIDRSSDLHLRPVYERSSNLSPELKNELTNCK